MPDRYYRQTEDAWRMDRSAEERALRLEQQMLLEKARKRMDLQMEENLRRAMWDNTVPAIIWDVSGYVMNVEYNQPNFGHGGRKKESGMNFSTAIFLINKHARAIKANYDPEARDSRKAVAIFKTLDPDIKVDDYIVVPTGTRHGFTVVKVSEVDIDLDLDIGEQIDWVVHKVDKAEFDTRLEQEAKAVKTIRSAEIRKKREDLAKAVLADSMDEIKALPISAMNGD